MKLSTICKINEGKRIIDIDEWGLNRKTWVLENPSAQSIVSALDEVESTLGGWTGPQGTWVWDRFRTNHAYVAKSIVIDTTTMIAFYIDITAKPYGSVTEVEFSMSEVGGIISVDKLMIQPIVNNILHVLSKRKDELNNARDEPLSTSDY